MKIGLYVLILSFLALTALPVAQAVEKDNLDPKLVEEYSKIYNGILSKLDRGDDLSLLFSLSGEVWRNRSNDYDIIPFKIPGSDLTRYNVPNNRIEKFNGFFLMKAKEDSSVYFEELSKSNYAVTFKINMIPDYVPDAELKGTIKKATQLFSDKKNSNENISFKFLEHGFDWTLVPNPEIGPDSFTLYREDIEGPVTKNGVAFSGSIYDARDKGFITQKAFDHVLALMAEKKYDSSLAIITDNTLEQNASAPIKNERAKELIRQVNEANKFALKFRDKIANYDVVVFKIPTGEEWVEERVAEPNGGGNSVLSVGHPVAFSVGEPKEQPVEKNGKAVSVQGSKSDVDPKSIVDTTPDEEKFAGEEYKNALPAPRPPGFEYSESRGDVNKGSTESVGSSPTSAKEASSETVSAPTAAGAKEPQEAQKDKSGEKKESFFVKVLKWLFGK